MDARASCMFTKYRRTHARESNGRCNMYHCLQQGTLYRGRRREPDEPGPPLQETP